MISKEMKKAQSAQTVVCVNFKTQGILRGLEPMLPGKDKMTL